MPRTNRRRILEIAAPRLKEGTSFSPSPGRRIHSASPTTSGPSSRIPNMPGGTIASKAAICRSSSLRRSSFPSLFSPRKPEHLLPMARMEMHRFRDGPSCSMVGVEWRIQQGARHLLRSIESVSGTNPETGTSASHFNPTSTCNRTSSTTESSSIANPPTDFRFPAAVAA
jgi:hypothetical protein